MTYSTTMDAARAWRARRRARARLQKLGALTTATAIAVALAPWVATAAGLVGKPLM